MDYQKLREQVRMSPSKPKQRSSRAKVPKAEQIEDSLIERHAKSQASIRSKIRKQTIKESELNVGVPNINDSSRSMAKTEIDIEYTKKNLGKEVSNSIRNTCPKVPSEFRNTDLMLNLSSWNMSYKNNSKEVPDIAKQIPGNKTKSGLSYESVKKTMISNLKKSKPLVEEKKYTHNINLSVEERTKQWMENKNQKVKKLRESSQERDLSECTFKPVLKRNSRTPKANVRETVRTVEYSPMLPFGKQLNFSSGFDMDSFMKRSKPMINYKHATFDI